MAIALQAMLHYLAVQISELQLKTSWIGMAGPAMIEGWWAWSI